MTSQNPETLRPEEPKSEETTEEKTKTYENDILDPVIQRTLSQVENQTDNDEQVREITNKFTEGLNDESRQGILKEYGEVRQKVHKKIEEREWDRFIEEYPEKVAAYKENLNIRAALSRREKKEKGSDKLEKKQLFQIESTDKRFELPGLEEAKNKKYPWAKTAESARKFLSDKITDAEDTLKQLSEGVKEGTTLHKQIQKEAYFRSKERMEKGEAGTRENDFFTAIDDSKSLNKTKLEMLNQRWQRLDVLSSEKKGNQDEELNRLAYEKAESSRKKGKKVDNIECNNKARQELLKEVKKGVANKEAKKEIENREEERTANLKTELGRVHNEIEGILEAPGEGEEKKTKEKIAKELYEKAKEITKSLTGEDLGEKVRNEAKNEIAREGGRVVTKKEYYNPGNIDKMEKRMQKERREACVRESMSVMDREEYGHNIEELFEKKEKERENVTKQLEEKGVTLSKDVYYELMGSGYKPQDIEVKGGWWSGKKIIFPTGGYPPYSKTKIYEFKIWTKTIQNRFDSFVKDEAKNEMDRRFIEGRNRLVRRKNRIMGETIRRVAGIKETIIEPEGAEEKEETKVGESATEQKGIKTDGEQLKQLQEQEYKKIIATSLSKKEKEKFEKGELLFNQYFNLDQGEIAALFNAGYKMSQIKKMRPSLFNKTKIKFGGKTFPSLEEFNKFNHGLQNKLDKRILEAGKQNSENKNK
ncbi:hypothetical protein KKE19_01040 [Patescibacteria group bacterium]|nr:hypothetical protein [Patescibacteria group bacterium]MBU4274380.1 hypothetical protein [Patescibacteria group bacterium]MBU4367512.1 hypothetical protein [Patescibacteria group bacterium]MBU4461553.1 hypothetical protein [Patescibacteria group bacterium]MCG2699450.1 hypothetical protein [Candidatus Parcubacteria bacterium]